jgi:hypothetical protein
MNMKVDSAILEQMRQNPATAVQDGLVVCLECGLLVRRLTRSPKCHARYTHNLDATAYLAKWPGASLQSADAIADERDKRELYLEINASELKAKKREYNQRPEVRARENEARRERWPQWYKDHQEAESERRKDRHERLRDQENAAGCARYQKNIEAERAKHRAKQTELRRLARLARASSKGRPREDAKAEMIHELRTRTPQVKWDDVLTLVVSSYGHIGLSACKNLYARWLKRTGRQSLELKENSNPK